MRKTLFSFFILFISTLGFAQILNESFDDITTLEPNGWTITNQSNPLGILSWFQGNDLVFPAHSGAPNSYIGANFNSTAGTGTISNWLITPPLSVKDGDKLSFWTRTSPGSLWNDRLEVRMSQGTMTLPTSASNQGSFTTVLMTVNDGYNLSYPEVWTKFEITVTGIGSTPVTVNFAFRYNVINGGPSGTNSNYIGIDDVLVEEAEEEEGCLNTSGYGSAPAPANFCNPLVTISTCNYAGEYATVTGATAGTEYQFASSIATDYLTIREGTFDGPVIAAGITPVTVTAANSGNLYIHIAADEDCSPQSSCRATTVEAMNLPGGNYCLVTSTNTSYGIDSFVTTGGVADIDNSGTGPGQYTDYTAMFVSQVAGGEIEFEITGVNSNQGYGIWVDWSGSDFCFADGDHHVFNSAGYVNGATGTITVPAGTPAGDYRMRIVGNWLSSNPLPCGGLGSTNYGEAEDYTFRVVGEEEEGCLNTSGYGSAPAPADFCNSLVTITTCNFAGEYATVTGAIAGTEYRFASSIATDYLTIREGTFDGPVIAAGITPVTITAANSGNLYIHIAADEDCSSQSSCRETTVEALNLSGGGDYCLVTSTNTSYGIDSFVTTGGVANIDNSGTGPGQYTDYTTMFVSQVAGGEIEFEITGVNSNQGYGIWVDWSGSDFCFADGDHHVFNSAGYVNGATGTITVPAGTPAGDYRMRVVGNWLSSNPLPCGGLGSTNYGEAEDYTFRVVDQTGGSETCFTEDFADITTGNSTETTGSGTAWAGNANFPTVEKAYQAGGAVKLGTGSLTGFIESRDLTEVTGDITVNIMVKGWTNVEGDLVVSIDGQNQTLSYTAKMADPFEQVTATFTGVTADSNLKIETTAKRAFIDNVEIVCDGGGGGTGEDCDQGDDSNGFENGFNIIAGGNFRNADDFFVSAGSTLNVQQIELNVFANAPFATMNFNFFEDDGGKPGSTIVESIINVPVTTVAIGGNFGFIAYATFAEVNLTFAPGHYWMQPEANTGGAAAYWEITTVGSLGDPIAGSTGGGAWTSDPDGSQGVFKLHCEAVDPPEEVCLFDITVDVEPITRVVLSDIDNASSPIVNGSPALEDFTSVVGHLTQGTSYEATFEGNTNGPYTNYFTIWIDFDQSGTYDAGEMFEIGSIVSSTGTDGKQATATIEVPADAPVGTTTMRVIKNYGTSPTNPCATYSFGQGEDYTIEIQTAGGGTEDCDQGDDTNGFENAFNIIAGGNYRNADDFFVSAGGTLNVQQIELNVFANAPFATMNFNFFEDDGGKPGSTIVESITNVPVTTVAIGGNFGYIVYATFAEVNVTFTEGHYWMQPEANTGGAAAFWEITTAGSLGDPIVTSELGGAWEADPDGSQGVFKLHCEAVDPPEEVCLFDITVDVEPITRVVLSDIDNASSPIVNGSPALEDFTSVVGHLTQGTSYEAAFEGNTNGPYTNYFTIWIDFDQSGTYDAGEMFEIGSIVSSTGTDGKQATATIEVPADAPVGTTTMRVIKNYGTSPTNPCGSYAFGQGEDYTIEIEETGGGGEDCDQGDDTNGFENGFNIIAGGTYKNADDFFVSTGNTLNIQQIELNVFATDHFATMNFNFYEDDGGKPGSTIVQSVTNVPVTTVAIGGNFGYIVYATFAEVNLTFTEGHYWMQPEANTGGLAAFWEITTVGSLGDPIVTSESSGAWEADPDGSQGVFKLHCDPVDPPEEQCLFNITANVEPITRVVLSDIDNASSPVVNGSPALEDFTSIIGHLAPGATYDAAFEGNTDGSYTNYFTIWIDFDQSGTYESSEMFEIGSIYNSTGTDGQQATASILIPSGATLGTTTMRVIKNYGSSPTDPCGIYSFGQGEDYTIVIEELQDCTGTPEGGTVTVNPDHGNPGSTYTVSANGYTIGNGLTYQWQSNTDDAGWVNEGTAQSSYSAFIATAPAEIGTEVDWRLEVKCTNSNETAYSTTDTFTVERVYCEPDVLFVEPITRVVFADIDNSSDPNSTIGYEDFTSIVGNVDRTTTYPIALEGNTVGAWTNYFTVWVDWNQNGTFEASEMYEIGSIYDSTGTDGQQATGEITIPADAVIGVTRMRIIKNFGSSPTDPCGSYTFGQVEDYSLNVQNLGTGDINSYEFSYWPNPVRDILNYSSQKTVRTVDVFNLTGQKVMNSDKVNNGQIDLSTLSPGVYVIKMNFDDGGNKIFKVIKK